MVYQGESVALFLWDCWMPTRVAELHLLQRVTPKISSTIIIFLRVAIFYGKLSARYWLVYNILELYGIIQYSVGI